MTLRESAKVLYTVTPTPDQIKQWQDNITTDKMVSWILALPPCII